MKSTVTKVLFVAILALSAVVAFAQVTLPPTIDAPIDYMKLFQEVIANPKALLSSSGIALAVFLTAQFLKRFGFKMMKEQVQFLFLGALGVVYALLLGLITGTEPFISVVIGLFGTHQASSLWSAIKLNFPGLLDFLGENK